MRQRLVQRDDDMVREYMKQERGSVDPRYLFRPGDQVLLKQRRPGKLLTKCTGPYKFVQYVEPRRVIAVIQ